jgi:hypothetical protein
MCCSDVMLECQASINCEGGVVTTKLVDRDKVEMVYVMEDSGGNYLL